MKEKYIWRRGYYVRWHHTRTRVTRRNQLSMSEYAKNMEYHFMMENKAVTTDFNIVKYTSAKTLPIY